MTASTSISTGASDANSHLLYQNGTTEQANIVKNAIENGGREVFAQVLEVIKNSNALEFTRQQAIKEAQLAKNAIMDLQLNEQYKTALLNLADFSVERRQ